ncbi:MAG TPA: polysaccharide lyase beta-sandwich domain-containing protein, partial [Thermoanaerobaculia bacterium]|nr:polysaccharide lyase beta-sandwich domain-containing protein [Thermoanaerobaculia bacterium]
NWAALGASDDTTPHTVTFTTMWLDHGTAPVNDTAAYAVVPSATADTMRSFVAPAIIANDANASAVRNGTATAIVFWSAGTVAGVKSDAPAIVYLTPTDLYVTDPTNSASGSFTITVPQGRFTIARNGGRTAHVALNARRRPAR